MLDQTDQRIEEIAQQLVFPLYHGTTSLSVGSIKQKGLDPRERSWDVEKMNRLHALLIKAGIEHGIHPTYDECGSIICVTSNYDAAEGYARDGPEIWNWAQTQVPALRVVGRLPPAEMNETHEIFSELQRYFAGTSPFVVELNMPVPELEEWFTNLARKIDEEGLSDRDVALYAKMVPKMFINGRLHERIPLQYIKSIRGV